MSGTHQRNKNGSRTLRNGHITDVFAWLRKMGVVVQETQDHDTGKQYRVIEKPVGQLSLSLAGVFDGLYNRKYAGHGEFPVRIKVV